MHFIDTLTDPSQNSKSELFKLSEIKKYIDYWSVTKYSGVCTICQFAFNVQKHIKPYQIKKFLSLTNEFAQKMPENIIGIICTWLFMRYVIKEININLLCLETALAWDPLSILFHNIIGCCDAEIGSDATLSTLSELLISPLLSTNVSKFIQKQTYNTTKSHNAKRLKVSPAADTSKVANPEDNNICTENHSHTLKIEEHKSALISFIRTLLDINRQKMSSKSKTNCTNVSGCLYMNDGSIDNGVKTKSLSEDYRIYVSHSWVESKMGLSYEDFMHSENYSKYMPGIYKYEVNKNEIDQKEELVEFALKSMEQEESLDSKEYNEDKKIQAKQVFISEGFVAAHALFKSGEICYDDKYIQEHKRKTDELKSRVIFLLSLINLIPNKFTNNSSPVALISKTFQLCKWCVFCIDPRMRMIINDLYVMCDENAQRIGIGTGSYAVKSTPNYNYPLQRVNKYRPHKQVKYTLGFCKGAITQYVLKAVFSDWYQLKFPMLQSIINPENEEEEINNLQSHHSRNKSIYCAGNIHRMYIQSDFHQKESIYRCPIIYAIKILSILLKMNVKLSKETGQLKKLINIHHLETSFMFV